MFSPLGSASFAGFSSHSREIDLKYSAIYDHTDKRNMKKETLKCPLLYVPTYN